MSFSRKGFFGTGSMPAREARLYQKAVIVSDLHIEDLNIEDLHIEDQQNRAPLRAG